MAYGKEQLEFFRNKNYLKEGETLEQRIDEIVTVVKKYEKSYSSGLGERIRSLINRQILSLSTPQWANMGRKSEVGSTPLPVSCNIISYPNSIKGIYYSHGEAAMLSKLGAGVGASFSRVYDKGTKVEEGFFTNPKLDWIEDFVSTTQKVSQGSQRRGYGVPFTCIDDPEFYDIIKRVSKTNPNQHDPLVENNIGIKLPINFVKRVKEGDNELRKRWLLLLQERQDVGKIYISVTDNANNNQSPVYKILGHTVTDFNICMEACTPAYDDKTFACVLSSLNLVHWDEIEKNPQIIKDAIMFLDIVVEEYIRLTEGIDFLDKVRKSSIEKRDIGLGTLGFAEYLQMNGWSFGGLQSRAANKKIFSTIRKYAEETTREMGERLGSPIMCQEAGLVRRNVSLLMVAPNKSTSFLCDTTPGIEPNRSNVFVKALAGIQVVSKNKYLQALLESKGHNTPEVWESIIDNLGSVQHLAILSKDEKAVFKTASEISPKDMIDLVADRQVFIDMSQSLNLFGRPNYNIKDMYDIHMYAIERGVKSLYYFYSQAHAAYEKEGEKWDTCEMCAD